MVHLRPLPNARAGVAALAVTAAAAALLTCGAAPASAAGDLPQGEYEHYVALGDSYAAGTGLAEQTDADCERGKGSYPWLLADTFKPEVFKDVTCSGATTHSLRDSDGPAAPQLDALTQDTDLVTVTLGGNDLGFTDVLVKCVLAGLGTREGAPCRDTVSGDVDAAFTELADRLPEMVADIEQRSPEARVVVVGYPNPFPAEGSGCGSSVPLAKGDVTWLHQTTDRLNSLLEASAVDKHADFVDTSKAFEGKDMCGPASTRWINPLLPVTSGSAHPNAAGHLATAAAVRERIEK
ncbi:MULTISPECIES: SGNH/GDSL hydrolase family protein [unclassified Streptomyces]|uniref:SGNH/GDSL hydrolase family protein n=1 Tax=unclassified Streptomyces TaxID=2593676 RepID=UPI0004CA0FC3|nr:MULTISPECIES: SGNH/GDSL hydrolase family protein [unclassified Streptomyces]